MTRTPLILALTLAALLTAASRSVADPLSVDEQEIIYSQIPERTTTLHPRMAELNGWAISQSEELTVLSGLQDIAELKITALSEQVVKLLDDPRELVKTTAIQTIGALDAKSAADGLLKFVELKAPYTAKQVEQVEMADALLSRWKDVRGVPHWGARLADAKNPMPLRVSAARALGAGLNGDNAAGGVMGGTVMNEGEHLPLRIALADALATAAPAGLEAGSEQLMARNMPGRLLASKMLRHHSGPKALELLTVLANDAEPAVQAPAMARLIETEPQRLWPTATQLYVSPDPKVRLLIVQASKPWRDTASVDLLGKTVDDPHPDVRNEARVVLADLAKDEKLNEPVKAAMRKWLEVAVAERKAMPEYEAKNEPDYAPHWRAAEQASILNGDLDDQPSNPLLLAMLAPDIEHPRLEARIAAADAVRKLHLPASRAPIHDLMKRLIDRMEGRATKFKEDQKASGDKVAAPNNEPDSKLAEIVAQTLGVWDVEEADATLRRLIPKHHPAFPRARGSAIWALGLVHAGKGEEMEPLAKVLEERLYDQNPLDPEASEVRLHSSLTIARMKVMSMVPSLTNRYENDGLEIKASCRWGIHHMTGEWLPAIVLEPGQISEGFIQPLD